MYISIVFIILLQTVICEPIVFGNNVWNRPNNNHGSPPNGPNHRVPPSNTDGAPPHGPNHGAPINNHEPHSNDHNGGVIWSYEDVRKTGHFKENPEIPENSLATPDQDFSVEIRREMNSVSGPITSCHEDCTFNFDDDSLIELTCKSKEMITIYWTDDNKFDSYVIKSTAVKLQLTPYEDDDKLNLTCVVTYDDVQTGNKTITVTLVKLPPKILLRPDEVKYLTIGDRWISDKCFGLAYYPKPSTGPFQYEFKKKKFHGLADHIVINTFNENLNGSTFNCIQYIEVPYIFRGDRIQSNVQTYKRLKTKHVFYTNREADKNLEEKKRMDTRNTNRHTEEEHLNINIHTNKEKGEPNLGLRKLASEEKKYDSETNKTAIVGGVLGSIILILLSMILAIWYKTIRRRAPDDGATEVIYTEIEERPTAPPPPPRDHNPYAKIMGTLVSTQQASLKENPYTTVEYESKNPYATINDETTHPYALNCESKDPHATVKRETNDPYATVKRDTIDPHACQT